MGVCGITEGGEVSHTEESWVGMCAFFDGLCYAGVELVSSMEVVVHEGRSGWLT